MHLSLHATGEFPWRGGVICTGVLEDPIKRRGVEFLRQVSAECCDMKVLLVNPSSPREIPGSIRAKLRYDPPLAALYIGSFLEEKGISCDVVDTAIEEIGWDKIWKGEYDLISFTIFIGEFLKNAKECTNNIRHVNPEVPIVFGGVMASIFPQEILEEYAIDYVVRYEGEKTLYELTQYLDGKRNIADINGLSYRSHDSVIHNAPRYLENDLDRFPVPKWELLGTNCNHQQIPYYFSILTSKGCPFRCSFCYNRQVEESILADTPVWRFRSADHVIAEIEHIHHLTGTRVFTIGDDNFLVRLDRALQILDHFRRRNYYIEQCVGHMNNFRNEDLMDAMRGIVQTAIYSLESASPRLLKLLHKDLDVRQVSQINAGLFQRGITSIHNFIIGIPTETDTDLKMNVKLMMELKEINPYVRGNPYLYLPLPFTPLESYIVHEMGYELPRSMDDFENARFDFVNGRKFRPWIDDERFTLLRDYYHVFRDAFQINNLQLSETSVRLLDENRSLRNIFSKVELTRKPSVRYFPYVLDRVLQGDPIHLERDLIEKANETG